MKRILLSILSVMLCAIIYGQDSLIRVQGIPGGRAFSSAMFTNGNIVLVVMDTTGDSDVDADIYITNKTGSKVYLQKDFPSGFYDISPVLFVGDTAYISSDRSSRWNVTYYYDPSDLRPRVASKARMPVNLFQHYRIGDKVYYYENKEWTVFNLKTRTKSLLNNQLDLTLSDGGKKEVGNKTYFLTREHTNLDWNLFELQENPDRLVIVKDSKGDTLSFDKDMYGSEIFAFKGKLCQLFQQNGESMVRYTEDPSVGWQGTYSLGKIKAQAAYPINDRFVIGTEDGNLWSSDGTESGTFLISAMNFVHRRHFYSPDRSKIIFHSPMLVTDGSRENTHFLTLRNNLRPGQHWCTNDVVYFQGRDDLFVSDYTTDGVRHLGSALWDDASGHVDYEYNTRTNYSDFIYTTTGLYRVVNHSDLIRVACFLDQNKNGKRDANEVLVPRQGVKLPNGQRLITGKNGVGIAVVVEEARKKVLNFKALPTIGVKNVTEKAYQLKPGDEKPDTIFFALEFSEKGGAKYLAEASSSRIDCGRNMFYRLRVTNLNPHQLPVTVEVKLDDSLTYLKSSVEGVKQDGQKLTLEIEDLKSLEMRSLDIMAKAPDFNSMGEEIVSNFVFSSSNGESVERESKEIVRCSYDPNDKKSEFKGPGFDSMVMITDTSEFKYTIRFQNYGNGSAFRVVVRDTLSPNLDFNTFRFDAVSHDNLKLNWDSASRELVFDFYDIELLPQSESELESQGYIVYSIEPKTGLKHNTMVANTAHIYFDFNPAIATNTTLNPMVKAFPSPMVTFTKADKRDATTADLEWTADYFSQDSFELESRRNDGSWTNVGEFKSSEFSFSDTKFDNTADSITYRIRSFNKYWSSEWDYAVLKGQPVDIRHSEKARFQLYPMPGNDVVTVKYTGAIYSENVQYVLLSVTGQVKAKGNISSAETRLDVSNLQSGMYQVHLISSSGTTVKPLVVSR